MSGLYWSLGDDLNPQLESVPEANATQAIARVVETA